ncbi:hypothetical protein ATY75_12080 [Rhizobium sp. N122]|uniref:hypothetical protein n=1 Tax=Rhizobium sp. N122 TaxID=1764272 RepID=UPI000B5AA9F4|nr:hypothetical protein [Rhizobium sp. N122]OWV62555.1 hypothetical protein ATY75_12080 [Rhizobium sp. N122]
MTVLLIMLQAILAAMIASCILVLLAAAFRYMRAAPEDRVLISDAPERGNVIHLHHFRRNASGSKLIAPATPQSPSSDVG